MGFESDSRRRKRPAPARHNSPPPKRANKASDADNKQHSRKVIKAIFRRFNVLSNPESEGRHLAFDALLDACEGEPAARRLAARFIPRFAAQFPGKHSVVARSLMELSAWDSHGLPENVAAVAQAARVDAFLGLGLTTLCTSEDASTDRTSSSVLLHLLRCLHQPKGSSKVAQPVPEHASVLEALQQIFARSPQAVLSACLESLSSGAGDLYDAAYEALLSFMDLAASPTSMPDGDTKHAHTAWTDDPKVTDWLAPTLQRLKGKVKRPELHALLDRMLKAISHGPEVLATDNAVRPPAQSPQHLAEPDKLRPDEPLDLPLPPSRPAAPAAKEERKPETNAPENSREGSSAQLEKEVKQPVETEPVGKAESGELELVMPADADSTEDVAMSSPEAAPAAEGIPRPPAPLSPDALPRAGGPCCLAFECLWLGGIQAHMVGEAQIRRACEEYGLVKRIVFLYTCGQAFVFFHEMSHTIACYEGMNGKVVLSRKPISVQFCEDSPEVASQPNCPLRLVVWLAMFNPQHQLEHAFNELRSSGVPKPTRVVNVVGHSPGALLYFSTAPAATAAVVALRSSAGREPVREVRSPGPRRDLSPRSSPVGRRSPPRQFPQAMLPDFATRTLWVGQVGPDVDEEEVIEAFKRHGRLIGYKLIRPSNCGFIDFERVEDAASARAALHEATFSSCQIRVEFKEEGRALGRLGPPTTFAPRGGPGGRFPRGRGRGRGNFDPWQAGPNTPPGFGGRGRGRGGWRGGRGGHPYDWNEPHRFPPRSPPRSLSPYGRSRQGRSPDRRGRKRSPVGRGRPSPDYNDGGRRSGGEDNDRRRARSRTRR